MMTKNVEEMHAIAAELLPRLVQAKVVFLQGELGGGKTTFAQGVGLALGILVPLRSPTFTLVNVYEVHDHPTVHRLVHADLYRLKSVDRYSWRDLGLEEYEKEPGTLVLLEWPERLAFVHEAPVVRFREEGDLHAVELAN